ncbi:MAG: 3-dehydro-L-gulonate 2-dehydrogenase [Flavisolibacter sp.]
MRIPFPLLQTELKRVLLKNSFSEEKAELCARLFAENSRDGVYSHGLNRFPVFVQYVKDGLVNPQAEPALLDRTGLIEHWDGHLGPGMYNAVYCMQRAISLAKENGLSMVTLKNTNHWMRAGSYGWQAAEAGCIGICSTNTIANMPPWGGKEPRLGNNPIVIAVPRSKGHVVLDMAVSQYSYGALQEYKLNDKKLPVPGGYDTKGKLTDDPSAIYESQRVLPVGFWKGSGLSLVIDILLTALTGGRSVKNITAEIKETGLSQFFICIRKKELHDQLINNIIEYTKSSQPAEQGGKIFYPGEKTLQTRIDNSLHGVPVNEKIWEEVLRM